VDDAIILLLAGFLPLLFGPAAGDGFGRALTTERHERHKTCSKRGRAKGEPSLFVLISHVSFLLLREKVRIAGDVPNGGRGEPALYGIS
jgi:hypothetical protein